MSVRAVLFDAGNTLLFLDYERLAAGITPVAGVPLTAELLASRADEAALVMERAAATDRERAALYLETLFRLAGVPEERLDDVRAALWRLHGERHLWTGVDRRTVATLGSRKATSVITVVPNTGPAVSWGVDLQGLTEVSLLAVWAAGPTSVFAGGQNGVVMRWTGGAWSLMPTPTRETIVPTSWPRKPGSASRTARKPIVIVTPWSPSPTAASRSLS